MGQPAYPTGQDLREWLLAAGLDSDTLAPLNDALLAKAGRLEFERRANRVMLAGAAATRVFDPPANAGSLLVIPDLATAPTITSLPYGGTEETLVASEAYRLEPLNALTLSEPYTQVYFQGRRYFEPLWGSQRGSIRITGQWGYATTIPEDAWLAMIHFAALKALPSIGYATFGGSGGWKDADRSLDYGPKPLAGMAGDWKTEAEATAARYRRWRI